MFSSSFSLEYISTLLLWVKKYISMACNGPINNINGTKTEFFCPIQNGGTGTPSWYLIGVKDENGLLILIIIERAIKLVKPFVANLAIILLYLLICFKISFKLKWFIIDVAKWTRIVTFLNKRELPTTIYWLVLAFKNHIGKQLKVYHTHLIQLIE